MGTSPFSAKAGAVGLEILGACVVLACFGSAKAAVAPSDLVAFYSPYSHQVWRIFVPGRLAPQAQNAAIQEAAAQGCGCASIELTEADVRAQGFSRAFVKRVPPALSVTSWGGRPNANLAAPKRFDHVIAEALDAGEPPDPRLIEAPR